jgi:PAS domain S-box-containing protein
MNPALDRTAEAAREPWDSLFEFLPIGAYRSTPEGRQLRANPALVRFNGFDTEAEQLAAVQDIGTEWYVQPGRRDEFKRLIERDGRVVGFESEVYRHKTREPVWVRENAHAVRDAAGQLRWYEGTVEEITDVVRVRERLRLSEASMKELVSLVPGVIYRLVVLPGGGRRFTFVSDNVRALLGLEPEQVVADGSVLVPLRHPDDHDWVSRAVDRATATGEPLNIEFRVRVAGVEKWLSWVSSAAGRQADGLLVRAGVITDITEKKRAELAALRSREELRQLVALIPGMVYRLRLLPDGRRVYDFVSERVRDIYGVEPAELLADGQLLTRMRHPDDRARIGGTVDDALAGERPLDYTLRILARDGTERWIQVISQPVAPDDGVPVRVGVLFDVTDRHRARLALEQQRLLWMRALEASGDGVWDWHVQDGVELLSPQCKALYGFAPDELPDTPHALDERTHPDDLDAMQADREAHFAGQSSRYVNEHRIRCKSGEWKWILSRGLLIERDAEGRPLRMIGTHTDVTAAKQAEALRLERDNAAAADRAKSQFLSRVSHELRTPLNAVLGFAQLLALDPAGLDERQRGWLGQVLTSGRHLLALLEDVLDLSSLQSGRLAMAIEPVLVAEVVAEAWKMLEPQAAARGLVFEDLVAGRACHVLADRKRLLQIVSNLLSNAVKYNRDGGRVCVDVSHHEAGDGRAPWCELQVSDSGPGLVPAQIERLFKPFDRLGAERGPVPGTGLGLALTLQLVEALDGRITVRSIPGEGSTFAVSLPSA